MGKCDKESKPSKLEQRICRSHGSYLSFITMTGQSLTANEKNLCQQVSY